MENIVPFWADTIDTSRGGYRLGHSGRRGIVTQARTLWLFSRLLRSRYGTTTHASAADSGFRFLRESLHDHEHEGFYWEVDEAGTPAREGKHLYGQAFAIFALSEYARVRQSQEAARLAERTFDVIESHAYDAAHGGYAEVFERDWTVGRDQSVSYLGAPPGWKLMNTHLHLLEAFTALHDLGLRPLVRDRLRELIDIIGFRVFRIAGPGCGDPFDPDWTPRPERGYDRISYGHHLESISLLIDAVRSTSYDIDSLRSVLEGRFEVAMTHGWDRRKGGFFESGRPGRPADRRDKIWWIQAEAMLGALRMYELTGESVYLAVFAATLEYVERHQVDWESGEWHNRVSPRGRPSGDKAGLWKAGYHNGRAMIESLTTLRSIAAGAVR